MSSILFAFTANAADMRIALVVKGLGIGFFEAAAEGGEEAAKEIGGVEVIYTGPAINWLRSWVTLRKCLTSALTSAC